MSTREPESLIEQALGEACTGNPPSTADTGELIRVEEMLAIATDAAKQAIALRRARRDEGEPTGGQRAEMGAAEAAASESAPHRVVTDAQGVTWEVFAVHPEPRPSPHSQLRGTFQQGWLCFDSPAEKKRLSPIPENWEQLDDDELARLSGQAERARSPRGSRPADGDAGRTESSPRADE